MDLWIALAGFGVGVVVGLTGMGGGALMTPLLVLVFGVSPLSAVSSDLVASAVMKPFGGAVHLRRGTVDRRLVGWLCAGSVPAAFAGVFVARALGDGDAVQAAIRTALGVALLLASAGLAVRAVQGVRDRRRAGAEGVGANPDDLRVRVIPTLLIGFVGGLIVGVTSVGSGSLMVIALMALYPAMRPAQLIGTDLVQAVPLVAAAAVAHLLFGDFQLGLTAALVLGSIPGVLLGAAVSARAPGGPIRAALSIVLVGSGLKLLGAGAVTTGVVAALVFLAWCVAAVAVRTGARAGDRADVVHSASAPND